jgi:ABC-type oligopeptide transport system substrate-binding subunit
VKSKLKIVILVAILLSVPGCSSAPSVHITGDIFQKTVAIPVKFIPSNLNPLGDNGSNFLTQMVLDQVLPQAFYINQNDDYQLNSNLLVQAELVGISPETILYQIQPKASWSDGVPITGGDFINQWQICLQALKEQINQIICPPGYGDISSITTSSSGKSVTVKFNTTLSDWETLFNNLLPAHIVGQDIKSSMFAPFGKALEVSGGPFEVAKYNSTEIILQRNLKFWNQNAGIAEIKFKLNQGDIMSQLNSLIHGLYQLMIIQPTISQYEYLLSLSPKVLDYNVAATNYALELIMNVSDQILSNKDLRDAIAHYLNRQELVSDTVGFINPSETEMNNHLVINFQKLYSDNSGPYFYANPALADTLMAQAGYHQLPDGRWANALNEALSLSLSYDQNDYYALKTAEYIQATLRDYGIEISLNPLVGPSKLASVLSGNFQLALVLFKTSSYISNEPVLVGLNNQYLTSQYINKLTDQQTTTTQGATTTTPGPSLTAPVPQLQALKIQPIMSNTISAFGYPFEQSLGFDLSEGQLVQLATLYFEGVSSLYAPQAQSYIVQADKLLWHQMASLPLFFEPAVIIYSPELNNVTPDLYSSGPLYNAQSWFFSARPNMTTSTS